MIVLITTLMACEHSADTSPVTPGTSPPADTADDCTTATFFTDGDGDGFGDPATAEEHCEAPSGLVAAGADCDDSNATVAPGAEEICGDGVINDCDGSLSEAAEQCGLAGAVSLSTGLLGSAGARLGASVSAAGDVDGDGLGDVLIGAPDDGGGVVTLFSDDALDVPRAWISGAAAGDAQGGWCGVRGACTVSVSQT